MDYSATLVTLQEANDLVKAFGKRSSRVPSAISVMDIIFNKLQSQVSWSKFVSKCKFTLYAQSSNLFYF